MENSRWELLPHARGGGRTELCGFFGFLYDRRQLVSFDSLVAVLTEVFGCRRCQEVELVYPIFLTVPLDPFGETGTEAPASMRRANGEGAKQGDGAVQF